MKQSVVQTVAVGFLPTVLEMIASPKKNTAPMTPITSVLIGWRSNCASASGRGFSRLRPTQPMTSAIAAPQSVHWTSDCHQVSCMRDRVSLSGCAP